MNFLKHSLLGTVFLLSLVCTVPAAVSVIPETGSFLVAGLPPVNLVTNAFTLNPATSTAAYTTNLPVSVGRWLPLNGASTMDIYVSGVQNSAGGATNNGATTLNFQVSPDGILPAFGWSVSVPSMGTTAAVIRTNIPPLVYGVPGYVRLYQVTHTNIGYTYFSNLTYRVVMTK